MYLNEPFELIQDFMTKEYGPDSKLDHSDLTRIELAYTETQIQVDSCPHTIEIQTCVDLQHFILYTEILNTGIAFANVYDSLEELVAEELVYMNFDDLVRLSDAEEAAVAAYLEA